jgi:hypothetical protein
MLMTVSETGTQPRAGFPSDQLLRTPFTASLLGADVIPRLLVLFERRQTAKGEDGEESNHNGNIIACEPCCSLARATCP